MEVLKKFGPLKMALVAFGVLASVILLLFLSYKLASPPMSLLYTGLTADDSALIGSRLEGMGEPYRIENAGKDVSVPVSKVLQLRMMFAQEGIPHSGSIVGYEIFDKNEGLGTSQFVYNINLVRALEGELARTIGSLSPIDSARVHLVMPKKELFSKIGADPSASVVLKMKGSQTLNKAEVAAVSHIVATAVPGLKLDNITIIDNRGKPLKLASTEDNNMATMTDTAAEYQKMLEDKYVGTLEELLEKSVGVGKIKANVSAEINFDREVINTETYDPDGQVVRSKKVSEENELDSEKSGDLSAATNLPGGQAGGAGGANRNRNVTNEVTNYEISKTVTNKISESGRIKRLSIAILVDGSYQIKPSEQDPDKPDVTYTPRSDQELEKIKLLAASAVGLDPKRGDKIEVINMQFSEEFASLPTQDKPMAWLREELDNIVQTVVIGIVIILVLLLIVRPVIIRSLEMRKSGVDDGDIQDSLSDLATQSANAAAQAAEVNAAMEAQNAKDGDISDIVGISPEDRKKLNLVKYVNELAEKHPEETVAILRNWMYSGGD